MLQYLSKLGFETPNQLFNSINPTLSNEEKHKEWYLAIKRVILVQSEDQRPPTLTALERHWKRSCWIKHMWENSSKPDQYNGLAPPESQGWMKDSVGKYTVDWEAEEVLQRIQATLDFLNKGCSCKTGCKTRRCSCRKNERSCGAGCECRECTNKQTPLTLPDDKDEYEEEVESEEYDSETDDEEVQTEVVTDLDDAMCKYWF